MFAPVMNDATSEILVAKFVDHESLWFYAALCKHYFRFYVLPEAFNKDRFSVFRVNHTTVIITADQTIFEQAMSKLGVELICAALPQAKRRVERANQTLQGRWVKEMRLAVFSDYQQAHVFLAENVPNYNQKFAVQPSNLIDRHIPLRPENDLEWIFTIKFTRKLSKDLQLQTPQIIYQIPTDPVYALKGREMIVVENQYGKCKVMLDRTPLLF